MKQTTKSALLEAYVNLQKIAEDLYLAFTEAIENGDDADASLIEAQVEKVFERAPGNKFYNYGARRWIEQKSKHCQSKPVNSIGISTTSDILITMKVILLLTF